MLILSLKNLGSAKFEFAFKYKNLTFGVWLDRNNSCYYLSNHYIKDTLYLFAFTLDDHTENTLFCKSAKKFNCIKNFIEAYNFGLVRFENQKIKSATYDIIKMLTFA